MTYKTIVLILADIDNAPQLLTAAVALAQRNQAHIIGVHPEMIQYAAIYAPMEIPDVQMSAMLAEQALQRGKEIEQVFLAKMAAEGVSHEWRQVSVVDGFSSYALIDTIRCADLIMVRQFTEDSANVTRSNLEGLLFDSGRPVLFVPSNYQEPKSIDTVLIAWNGSREAARAVNDAMPFLLEARSVEILSIDGIDDETQTGVLAGAELATSLARHGLNVKATNLVSKHLGPELMILQYVTESKADLLVMGAFTHSRVTEWLLGGVTHRLMSEMTSLTLMAR